MNDNPDPSKYAASEDGYILRPRQCKECKGLFTPYTEFQCICFICNPRKNMPEMHLIPFKGVELHNRGENLIQLRSLRAHAKKTGNIDRFNMLSVEIEKLVELQKKERELLHATASNN